MKNHKGIEECIYRHLKKYPLNIKIIEIGIGKNWYIAEKIKFDGFDIKASDIKDALPDNDIPFITDDIFEPQLDFYNDADLIYSIRPGIEMLPALISLAEKTGAELLVYHLGYEIYKNGGEIIDCGVILHRYCKQKN